jgi:hypothetical protein
MPATTMTNEPPDTALFGERLAWYRRHAGLNRRGLRYAARLWPGAVGRYESWWWWRRPGPGAVLRIASTLNIPRSRLMSAPDMRHQAARLAREQENGRP